MSTTTTEASPDYTAEDLAKLAPCPELDMLVHTKVFKLPPPVGARKRVPKYSRDIALIAPAIESLPIGFGKSLPSNAFYSEGKPYWAGNTQLDIIFVSGDPVLAACKAAVYIAQQVAKQEGKPNVGE